MKKRILKVILIILVISVIFFVWEQIVIWNRIPQRILPKPSQIIGYIWINLQSGNATLFSKTFQSFLDALIGFFITVVLGTGVGIIFASKEKLRVALSPFVFITQLIPVPAFTPVVAALFGYGSETKIFIIVLFTIFPVIVTVEKAIVSIPENYFSLFKTFSADRWTVIKKLVFPAVIPKLLTTLKILTTASVVTSIIAELPLTLSSGIGKDIFNSFNNQIIARVWASLLIISLISLAFFYSIVCLEKYIILKYRYDKD